MLKSRFCHCRASLASDVIVCQVENSIHRVGSWGATMLRRNSWRRDCHFASTPGFSYSVADLMLNEIRDVVVKRNYVHCCDGNVEIDAVPVGMLSREVGRCRRGSGEVMGLIGRSITDGTLGQYFMAFITDRAKHTVLGVLALDANPDVGMEVDDTPAHRAGASVGARKIGLARVTTLSNNEGTRDVVKEVNGLISNAKKVIDGSRHWRQEVKQFYLERLASRFNVRRIEFSLVDYLLITCALAKKRPWVPSLVNSGGLTLVALQSVCMHHLVEPSVPRGE